MATNIISKNRPSGYVQLTAKKGYNLYSKQLGRVVSEAVVKPEDVQHFEAVKEDRP